MRDQPDARQGEQVTGDVFRSKAAEFAPDPQTAHVADQVMYGLTRFGAKAAAAMLVGGPAAGAAMLAAEETNTAFRGLLEKGVDSDTALLTGMVTGVVNAAGVALPVSGAALPLTLGGKAAATAGLVAVGGPGSFVAQEIMARDILAGAGYDLEAATHDPTNPLGLALSVLLPGLFGAVAMRGAYKGAMKTEADVKAAVQMSPAEQAASDAYERSAANLKELRDAIAAEKRPEAKQALQLELMAQEAAALKAAPDEATLDAARVVLTERSLTANLPDRPDARGEVLRAMDEVAAGRMPDVLPFDAGRAEEADRIIKLADELGVQPWDIPDDMAPRFVPEAAAMADDLRAFAAVAFWAQEGGGIIRSGISEPGDQSMGGAVTGRLPWIPAAEWFGRMRSTLGRDGLTRQKDIAAAVEKAIRGEKLKAAEQRTVDYMRAEVADMASRARSMEFMPDEADNLAAAGFSEGLTRADAVDLALTAKAAELDPDGFERAAMQFENDDAGFMQAVKEIIRGNDQNAGARGGGEEIPATRSEESATFPGPEELAAPPEPPANAIPRDIKAESIALRKAENLLSKLLECVT
jgi:hypothetical protein